MHAVENKKGQPATTADHHGPTAFKLLIDEAKSQSYAKTPKLEHFTQQADAEDVVMSLQAQMGSHVGVLK